MKWSDARISSLTPSVSRRRSVAAGRGARISREPRRRDPQQALARTVLRALDRAAAALRYGYQEHCRRDAFSASTSPPACAASSRPRPRLSVQSHPDRQAVHADLVTPLSLFESGLVGLSGIAWLMHVLCQRGRVRRRASSVAAGHPARSRRARPRSHIPVRLDRGFPRWLQLAHARGSRERSLAACTLWSVLIVTGFAALFLVDDSLRSISWRV